MTTALAQERPTVTSDGQPLTGSTRPRLWTRPRRRLTPRTSRGYAVIAFAEALGIDLMPWQRWALVHALELNRDGTYRFRTVLLLVGRQNGKTSLLRVLTLWRMVETETPIVVLGSSTNLEYAREAWETTVALAEDRDAEADGTAWVSKVGRANSNTYLLLNNRSRYKIATAGRRGGRSLAVDLGVADELREHHDWAGWAAMSGTTTARPDPQLWALSNAGEADSVVLNHLQAQGRSFIETGEGDDTLALFEWSAPEECELDDRRAWAMANPAMSHTITEATLAGKCLSLPAEVFRVEHLCQGVPTLNPALDPQAWKASGDVGTLDALRSRVVVCLDVSPDLSHVSLVAGAALDDGRVRIEPVAAWSSTQEARLALPDLLARIKPRAFGWFPGGPAAAMAPDLRKIRGNTEITNATEVCQVFAEQVAARRVLHPDDPMLTGQALGVSKTPSGDGWRFTRNGAGNCDAVYAAAGVVSLARTVRKSPGKPRVLLPT